MKTINIWMLGAVLFSGLMSCEMKEEIFGKDIPEETGFLALDVNAGSSASVETKAVTDDTEAFPLVIKSVGTFELTKNYESFAKFKEENADGKITLPVGTYEVEACSPGEFADKMSAPYYSGKEQVEIAPDVEKKTTVKCKIQNVKIVMNYTPEFINKYSAWSITIDDKKGISEAYTEADKSPAAVYWKMKPETDKIYVTGEATLKDGGETVTIDQTLRKKESPDFTEGDSPYFVGGDGLAISLAPNSEVNLDKNGIKITVNGFNQETNGNIDIDVEVGGDAGGGTEEPEPPVTGEGPTIQIPQAAYTLPADAALAGTANAVIKSDANLTSIRVQIAAGNDSFGGAVETLELGDFDLMTVEKDNADLAGILTGLGIALPTTEDKEYKFPVGSFFEFLSPMGATTSPDGHVFNITVTDANGKSKTSELSVKVTE